jgi:hypothetical protein
MLNVEGLFLSCLFYTIYHLVILESKSSSIKIQENTCTTYYLIIVLYMLASAESVIPFPYIIVIPFPYITTSADHMH